MADSYDVIVVGGGSAGCVVAGALSKDPKTKVLLLEAGPAADAHPEVLRSDGYKDAFVNDAVFNERFSEPQAASAGVRYFVGTGGVLGGSGSVNGMVYTRGAAQDFDEWPTGWKWADVQEDFRSLEAVLRPNRRSPTRWTEGCIDAAVQEGFRRKEDLNDGDIGNVIGYEWMNFEGETRRSSYVAFLRDAGPRENLTVISEARVHRVLFEEGRAVGVHFDAGGDYQTAYARREVVLSAGALESAKLLMLSGVGPAEHLRQHHIPVIADRPEVGNGLHDHPNVPVFFKAQADVDCQFPQVYSFYRTLESADLPEGQSDTCYVFWPAYKTLKQMVMRMGPTKLPHGLYGPGSKRLMRAAVQGAFRIGAVRNFADRLFGIIVILGKPKSRGTLRLASTNAAAQAAIDPAYFSDPQDMDTMIAGVKKARAIARAEGLAPWQPTELMPGTRAQSDAAIRRYVKTNAITTYHFAGTCRMGESESDPVDTQLRLRGVRGLRVADASVIPWTPVSALNAPSMLIGFRAAKYLGA